MKIARLGLCVLLGVLLAVSVYAQAPPSQREIMRSPAMQRMQKNAMKQAMRSFWTGDGTNLMAIGLLQDNDFREGLGVSQEQSQKIQGVMQNLGSTIQTDPEIKPIFEEINTLMRETPGGIFAENITEEKINRFFDLQSKMQDVIFQKMYKSVNENLTPEQLRKVKEFQISTMSEIPIGSPNMYEALDLSAEQKKQLDDIKKELEPEFEKNIDKMADAQARFMSKFQEELADRLEGVTDPEEIKRISQEVAKKVRDADPEAKRLEDEIRESGKAFASKLKFRMFDVLTDEQMERMADLIDNPPDYIKKVLARVRKEMGTDEAESSGEWKPGINSWKPGDPIPKEYLEQRKERKKSFPQKK